MISLTGSIYLAGESRHNSIKFQISQNGKWFPVNKYVGGVAGVFQHSLLTGEESVNFTPEAVTSAFL